MRTLIILSLILLCRISVSQEMPGDATKCLALYKSETAKAKQEYEEKVKKSKQKAVEQLKEIQKGEMKKYKLATANAIQKEIDRLEGKDVVESKPKTIKTVRQKPKTTKQPKKIFIGEFLVNSKNKNPVEVKYRGRKYIVYKDQTIIAEASGRWRTNRTRPYCDYKGHSNDGILRLQYSIGDSEPYSVNSGEKEKVLESGTIKLFHNDNGVRDNEGSLTVRIYLIK